MSGADAASGAEGGATSRDAEPDGSVYECNICLDTARDAVVSMCGHLFCWSCLHQWLETRPNRQTCPVCKAGISKDQVVPIYGRGSTDNKDPREKLPPRPAGQRAEPENQGTGVSRRHFGDIAKWIRHLSGNDVKVKGFPGFGFGDGGFHMSFGIGAFPLGIFASTFNFNDGRPGPPPNGTPQHAEEQILSKFFLWVAVIFLIWLLLA